MIAKIMKRSSFGNVVNYVFKDGKDAKLLASEGVRTNTLPNIIACFTDQASQNEKVKNMVGHTALSFSENDNHKLTNERIIQIVHDYMEKMGIKNTQYIIVRHFDRDHPHIHIVYNRVDNDGHTISDSKDQIRSAAICKQITLQYGLYMPKGKEKIKSNRLHGMDKEKFQLYTYILDSLHNCNNWDSFQRKLERRGITISFRRNENGNVHGICFTIDGHTYSGSKIDRSLGYNKLVNVLGKTDQFQQNLQELTPNTFAHVYQEKLDDGSGIRIYEPDNTNTDNGPSLGEKLVNAAIEFALQPHVVPSSGGGGGGSSDDEENDKDNKNNKPRKFRRR